MELVLDEEKMKTLGQRLFSLWETYRTDRKPAEDKWLRNLRQFRGIYDPEILTQIPKNRSKAYPKLTRWKVIGTVARLMQMLFPQTEENYNVTSSQFPNISQQQLQQVLDALVASKAGEGVDPKTVVCTAEEIESAIHEFAKGKAERMQMKLKDDLQEMEYTSLARKVVFSGVLYNVGILEGPFHIPYKARTWQRDELRGTYKAVEVDKLKPRFEFCPVWEYYPDMSATALDKQDGSFRRRIFTRKQVEDLGLRPDFFKANIDAWLLAHKDGNHKPEEWETALKGEAKGDKTAVSDNSGRKYVVLSWIGGVTGHELKACGADIKDDELGKTFDGEVWLIENTVIKCKVAMLAGKSRRYHEFVFEDDDLSLLGNGQCDTLRDSQLSIGEAARMLLDEASVGGENLIINVEKLAPGQNHDPQSHKVWKEETEGVNAQTPAVRVVPRQSRIADLMNQVNLFMEFADKESGLPPPSMGDVSQGGSEALRTQGGASMFLGAAALPIRDTVRNFDAFTISVMKSLVEWNMRYDPNDSRDGDHDIIARGSTSLIAKEVLAQSFDVLAGMLSDEDRQRIDGYKFLTARMKARDIPIDEVALPKEEGDAAVAAWRQAQSKAAELQEATVTAKVKKDLADAILKVSQAKAADTGATVDVMTMLMEALNGDGSGAPAGAGSNSSSAAA